MAETALNGEQRKALENTDFAIRYGRRQSVYRAYAGGGKTFILVKTAEQVPGEVLLIAFNAAIIKDVAPRLKHLKGHVRALTSHQLALRSLPVDFQAGVKESLQEHNGQLAAPQIVEALDLQDYEHGGFRLSAMAIATSVGRTVTRFCQTADDTITSAHIPRSTYIPADMLGMIVHEAERLWAAFQSLSVPITHDAYFKLWALSKPQIPETTRLIDESQDTNPVLTDVMLNQKDGLNVWAGDPYQSIYSWRGAKNALEIVSARSDAITSLLTQSFRFGEETAAMATKLLGALGETHPVRGTGSTKVQGAMNIAPSHVAAKVSSPFAWIAFTNTALIKAAVDCTEADIPFHIVGQGRDQKRLIFAAMALKRGEYQAGGPLAAYKSWSHLQEEAEHNPNGDAAKIVKMQQYPGFYAISNALKASTPNECDAKVILTTVHAAKGREWDLVVLDADLDADRVDTETRKFYTNAGRLHFDDREDVHLRYVAITRARKRLVMTCPLLHHWLTR